MPETQTQEKAKPVNILDPSLDKGVEQELNPEADAWGALEPPPKGCYPLRLMLGATDPWTQAKRRDNQAVYYRVNLECRINDGEYKDVPVYAGGSTLIARGREISTVGGLIRKAGFKLPTKMTDLAQAKLFAQVLAKGVVLWADCDWEAWSRSEARTIKAGMENFPEDPEGGYQFTIQDKDGNECNARLRVKKWYGVKEEHPALGASPATAGGELEVVVTEAPAGKPAVTPKTTKKAPVKAEEDELVLDD